MANNSFRREVDSRLGAISLSPELREKILLAAGEGDALPCKKPRAFKKRAMMLVAACLVLALGIAAARIAFPSFDALVRSQGGEVESFFQPVSLTSDSAGIRMEVVAAYNDGDSAIVYLTLQDREGDRIDSNTVIAQALFGGWLPADGQLVHFDEHSRVATYRYEVQTLLEPFDDAPLSLQISDILLGEKMQVLPSVGYTLADFEALNANPVTLRPQAVAMDMDGEGCWMSSGVSYGNQSNAGAELEALLESGDMPLLQPGSLRLPVDNFSDAVISSAGVVDGYLHVRLQKQGETARFNEYNLVLNYPGRSFDKEYASAHISLAPGGEEAAADIEWIFELPRGVDAQKVTVELQAITYESVVEGDWSVTFQPEEPDTVSFEADFDWMGNHVTSITVSPLGVSLDGTDLGLDESEYEHMEVQEVRVLLRTGEEIEMRGAGGGISFGPDGEQPVTQHKFYFTNLTDLADIESIWVGEREFRLP